MRVIHYLTSASHSAGGLYYSVSGLAKAQKALGADVSIVGGADATFGEDRHIWGDLLVTTHPYTKNSYGFYPRVARLLVKARPDILHIHGIWSGASVYGRIASAMGIATVNSPRGMLDPWIVKRKPLVKKIHAALFERPFLRHSAIHALNESEKNSIIEYFSPDPVSVFVVPNGVDLLPVQSGGARQGALYLGRLHEKKQVLELIHHWGTQECLANVPLTIAGWGAPEYEGEVVNACAGQPNIVFVGQAYGPEKAALLAGATYFVLPSLSEGLPMAVLEALAGGCIPVITRECNLPELMTSGSAIGMNADFSDFGSVANRIAHAPQDSLDATRRRGTEDALGFAWPGIAARVLKGYEEFLNARRW